MNTANRPASRWEILLLGVFAALMLVPVTLPVPVLRGLVQERFQVSAFETSVFMSINMVGAFLAAPLAGALADRYGQRKTLIVLALLVDSVCFFSISIVQSYELLLAVRFAEGFAKTQGTEEINPIEDPSAD